MTAAGMARAVPGDDAAEDYLLMRWHAGTDGAAARRKLVRIGGPDLFPIPARLPVAVADLARVEDLPLALAGFFALLFITLPLMMPTVIVAILLRGIDALKTFDILYATKGKGGGSFHEVETLNVYAYGLSFDYNQYGLSSAVLILFFMIIIGSMWLLTMRKKAVSK